MVQTAPTNLVISEALIARLCRATPIQALALSLELSAPERAKLAVFCNARAHLRSQGRAIASACTEASLLREAGQAGLILLQQATVGPDTWGLTSRPTARGISLSRPSPHQIRSEGPNWVSDGA